MAAHSRSTRLLSSFARCVRPPQPMAKPVRLNHRPPHRLSSPPPRRGGSRSAPYPPPWGIAVGAAGARLSLGGSCPPRTTGIRPRGGIPGETAILAGGSGTAVSCAGKCVLDVGLGGVPSGRPGASFDHPAYRRSVTRKGPPGRCALPRRSRPFRSPVSGSRCRRGRLAATSSASASPRRRRLYRRRPSRRRVSASKKRKRGPRPPCSSIKNRYSGPSAPSRRSGSARGHADHRSPQMHRAAARRAEPPSLGHRAKAAYSW